MEIRQSTITCIRCRDAKNPEDFYTRLNTAGVPVPRGICKACQKVDSDLWRQSNRERHNRNARERRTLRSSRLAHVKKTFGLTAEQYEALEVAQDHKCAICQSAFADMIRNPHVDHCHKTGKVRGLLCGGCNQAMGNVRDDPARLRALADYLDRHAG